MELIALHGFLGSPLDWKPVFESMKNSKIRPRALDYTKVEILSPEKTPLAEWGHAFKTWFETSGLQEPIVIAGYSQGGRLALQILKDHPELVRGVVVVSGNPGFTSTQKVDREQRRRHDEDWAQRFETDDWAQVCAAWNSQPIFHGGVREPQRAESADLRKKAAASLRSWSLAEQEDFRPQVQAHAKQLAWLVGEQDLKYRGIVSALKTLAADLTVEVALGSGHRVLFDNPLALAALIDRIFIELGDRPLNP